ncbi:MAG: tetratricopeptide repeat protein [Bacteroidia bacterium]|nr:tetratricopeptide repeat protein [Bacteroidia bacterium]
MKLINHILLIVAVFMLAMTSCVSRDAAYDEANTLYHDGLEKKDERLSESAAEDFNAALDIINRNVAEDDVEMLRLRGLVLDNLGAMYWKHNLMEEALKCHQDAVSDFSKTGDDENKVYAIRNCGRAAASCGQLEEAKKYYEETIELSKTIANQILEHGTYIDLARDYYLEKGEYETAIQMLLTALDMRRSDNDAERDNDVDICNMTLGVLYYYTKDYGLARKHLNDALRSERAGLKMSCYQTLYAIEYKLGNMRQAIDYQKLFTQNMMQMESEHRSDNMQRIKADYDLKAQENEIMIKQKVRNLKMFSIAAAIVIVMLVLLIVINRKLAQNRLETEQFRLQMERNQKRISELVREKEDLVNKNEQLSNLKHNVSDKEASMINMISANNKILNTAKALTKHTTAETLNFTLTENDWEDFVKLTDLAFSDFTIRLTELYPKMTKWDVRICCLAKHQFQNSVISILLDTQTDSFYKRKKRIKQLKMNDDERSFEEIIKDI